MFWNKHCKFIFTKVLGRADRRSISVKGDDNVDIPELREENRPTILRQLIENNLRQKSMTLWQRLECSRDKMIVKLVKVDRDEGRLKFYPADRNGSFRFRSHLPVYLYSDSDDKTIIFKTTIIYQSGIELELRFPSELRIQELRESARLKPDVSKPEMKVSFDIVKDEKKKSMIKSISNFSKGGFSFLVPSAEYPMYYENDILQLKPECSDFDIPSNGGRIIHITRQEDFNFFGKEAFTIGVEYQPEPSVTQ